MPRIAFRNFTGGEVTPTLSARYDLQKFGTFLQCCENFIPNVHGDIERRPGTKFIGELEGPAVLLPFSFNTDPENNYTLIFQVGAIRVATAEGIVAGVSINSPYELEDVYHLSFAQVGDIVYLAHKNYPLHKLTRSGNAPDYEWALTEVALNMSLPAPDTPAVSWHRGPKNTDSSDPYTKNENSTLRYKVTAVDADGVESLASEHGEVTARYPSDWVQGDYVELRWQAVEGAEKYNVYRESGGYYGFIGVVDGKDTTGGTLTNIKVGSITGSKVKYIGTITDIVIGAIGANYNPDDPFTYLQGPEEYIHGHTEVTNLIVKADGAQAAFFADGKFFVLVKKHIERKSWYSTWTSMGDSGTSTYWYLRTDEERDEFFWVMLTPKSSSNPAGEYTSWVVGQTDGATDGPNGTFGAYTVTPVYEGASTLVFQDQNFEPDTSMTPKEDWDPFADGNNPSAVAFHQQRLVLAGTRDNPASFYMSRTGDFENFRKSMPLQDDDPIEYMLASGSIDDIKWVASFGDLLIGTSGAEFTVTSSSAAITHADVQIKTESYWGSAGIQPIIIGNSIMHCQRSGSHVRDLAYSWEQDGYAGNDLSILAPQLVESNAVRQWAFQQSPGSNLWCVREDGTLLCLTYMQEQKVYGWSRHVTDGKILSVAAISGAQEDVVMLVTERMVGGRVKYFLERLAMRLHEQDSIEDAVYLDCSTTFTRNEAAASVSGLSYLEGADVVALADGAPVDGLQVKGGNITLPYSAKTVTVGLTYASVLSPLPVETDSDGGSTLGKRRAYGKVVLRLHRTVGGSYAATRQGDLFDVNAWKVRDFYDLPFLPEAFGEACKPFSGDIEITLPAGQDQDTSIILKQDRPLPFRLVAIIADIDFGEQ